MKVRSVVDICWKGTRQKEYPNDTPKQICVLLSNINTSIFCWKIKSVILIFSTNAHSTFSFEKQPVSLIDDDSGKTYDFLVSCGWGKKKLFPILLSMQDMLHTVHRRGIKLLIVPLLKNEQMQTTYTLTEYNIHNLFAGLTYYAECSRLKTEPLQWVLYSKMRTVK